MRYRFGKAQWIGARSDQQDVCEVLLPKDADLLRRVGILGVLADGVGSVRNGAQAAAATVSQFVSSYRHRTDGESVPFAFERSLREANDAVVALGATVNGERSGCATIVSAVIQGNSLYWISAGDSRAYLVRTGRLYRLTTDHTVGTMLSDAVSDGALDLSEAEQHPDHEQLVSYLGQPQSPKSDGNIDPFPISNDDQVLLCTDGVYRTLNEEDIAAAITVKGSDLEAACANVIRELKERAVTSQDNATVIILAPRRTPLRRKWILRSAMTVLVLLDLIAFGVWIFSGKVG